MGAAAGLPGLGGGMDGPAMAPLETQRTQRGLYGLSGEAFTVHTVGGGSNARRPAWPLLSLVLYCKGSTAVLLLLLLHQFVRRQL